MQVTCPNCGDYTGGNIGCHWAQSSSCTYPDIENEKLEIMEGLLMGDGCIDDPPNQNSSFILGMTNKSFIDYISSELGWMASNISKSKTAHESAKQAVRSGFHTDAKGENYSDVYRLTTPSHPQLSEMREEWYSDGEKIYPKSLELTPRRLRLWYVTDGYRDDHSSRVTIGCKNEISRRGNVLRLFEPLQIDPSYKTHEIVIKADDREKFFEYIGNPVDGFKYKWPERFR